MAAYRKITLYQGLYICVISFFFVSSNGFDLSCIEVKKFYKEKGSSDVQVPIQAIDGTDLQICSQGETCCTRELEQNFENLSTKDYEVLLETVFRRVRSTLSSRTRKFDDFFMELLRRAKSDLHEMFINVYGLIYQRNAQVFADFFKDLENYYKGKSDNLTESIDNFFKKLLRRMFQILSSGEYQESYLQCVTSKIDDLQPFGGVPKKLSSQLKRSFVAARTFVQGLVIGRDVITEVLKIPPSDSCLNGLMRMTYCPICQGLTKTKPCSNYCLNVQKGCLAYHAELNTLWNEYIDAMDQLADRLDGSFNIESVLQTVKVQLSEAVMTMQEDDTVIYKIQQGCGRPSQTPISRLKRQAGQSPLQALSAGAADKPQRDNTPPSDEDITKSLIELQKQFGDKLPGINIGTGNTETNGDPEEDRVTSGMPYNPPRWKKAKQPRYPVSNQGTTLNGLVKDIKEKIKVSKDFWVQLPYSICIVEDNAEVSDDNCWNGSVRAQYKPDVQKDGFIHQINNPEVEVDVTTAQYIIEQQKVRLQLITNHLSTAVKGGDVDWILETEINPGPEYEFSGDYQEGSGDGQGYHGYIDLEGSGSGSGSGSTTGFNFEDDDEDHYISITASGDQSYKPHDKKEGYDTDTFTNVVEEKPDNTYDISRNFNSGRPVDKPKGSESSALQTVSSSLSTCMVLILAAILKVFVL